MQMDIRIYLLLLILKLIHSTLFMGKYMIYWICFKMFMPKKYMSGK